MTWAGRLACIGMAGLTLSLPVNANADAQLVRFSYVKASGQ